MQSLRVIEFVRALEKESYEKPKRLWHQAYHIIRRQSVNAGFEFLKKLSKELLGKELTHEEIIASMNYIEAKKKLAAFVSSELYKEYSPYLYTVREFDNVMIENAKDFKELEKLISQWQKKQIDQAYVYIALFTNRWFTEDAVAFNLEETISLVEHYMKTAKDYKNYAILCKFRTHKGFDTMESLLDYIEGYLESHALILRKQAEGVRINIEKDTDYYAAVYIEYWQETWKGLDVELDVDGVQVEIDGDWLKRVCDTYGKRAVAEYMEYLFKEKEYLSPAIDFLEEYKKSLDKNKFSQVKLSVNISDKNGVDGMFVDIYTFPPFDLDLDELIDGLIKRLTQTKCTPNKFLHSLLLQDTLQNMWHLRL